MDTRALTTGRHKFEEPYLILYYQGTSHPENDILTRNSNGKGQVMFNFSAQDL